MTILQRWERKGLRLHPFLENLEKVLFSIRRKRPWLADEIGISVSTINSWFSKNKLPLLDNAYKVAKVLNVSLDFLMTGEEPKEETKYSKELQDFCDYLLNMSEGQRNQAIGAARYVIESQKGGTPEEATG